MIKHIAVLPVLATSADDLSNLLVQSIEFENAKKTADKLAAENAFLYNQIIDALNLFEGRFLSDPSQFAPGEFDWYKSTALEMKSRFGRPEITRHVSDYIFQSIMGEVL